MIEIPWGDALYRKKTSYLPIITGISATILLATGIIGLLAVSKIPLGGLSGFSKLTLPGACACLAASVIIAGVMAYLTSQKKTKEAFILDDPSRLQGSVYKNQLWSDEGSALKPMSQIIVTDTNCDLQRFVSNAGFGLKAEKLGNLVNFYPQAREARGRLEAFVENLKRQISFSEIFYSDSWMAIGDETPKRSVKILVKSQYWHFIQEKIIRANFPLFAAKKGDIVTFEMRKVLPEARMNAFLSSFEGISFVEIFENEVWEGIGENAPLKTKEISVKNIDLVWHSLRAKILRTDFPIKAEKNGDKITLIVREILPDQTLDQFIASLGIT